MKRKNLLTLLILLTSISAFSQIETLVRDADEKTLTIKSSTNSETSEVLNILKNCVGPQELKFDVKEHHEIYKKVNTLSVKLAVGNLVQQGKYTYNKFPIDHLIIPTTITYTYVFSDKNGKALKTESFTNANFKSGAYIVKFSHPEFDGDKESTIKLTKLEIGYNSRDLDKLSKFIETINSYYDADASLHMINRELDAMYMDSIELLKSNLAVTEGNIEKYNAMKSQRFFSKLDLDTHDPIGFKSHLGKTYVRNRQTKQALEHKLKYMHETYYLKGMEWLIWGDTVNAQTFFHKSIGVKKTYAPPIYQISEYNFKLKKYDEVLDSCEVIANKLSPDTDTRYNTVKLAEAVIYIYIDSINKHIDNGEFEAGMQILNKCKDYAARIKGVRRFSEFDDIYARVNLAYYNQFADATQKKLDNFELYTAKFNIDSLYRFRKAFPGDIPNEDTEHELQNGLYSQWIVRGKNSITENNPDTAYLSFTNAKATCVNYKAVECTNELDSLLFTSGELLYTKLIDNSKELISEQLGDSAINTLLFADRLYNQWKFDKSPQADSLLAAAYQVKYKDLIAEGDLNVEQGDARQGLAYYSEAKELSQTVNTIKIDNQLPAKVKFAASAIVIKYCDHGLSHVQALQMPKAQQFLGKAEAVANQYNVTEEEDVKIKLDELRAALISGKCDKALFKYNIKYKTGEKFITKKDFIKAYNALSESIDVCYSYKDCDLPLKQSQDTQRAIRPIRNYQLERLKIEELINEKEFEDAIEKYMSLTTYYNDSVKFKYGISHDSTYQFIKSHKDLMMKDYAVIYYTESEETDRSIELLYLLYEKEYNPNWAKECMYILGQQLALTDFENDKEADPEKLIVEVSKGDRWFRHLEKAYMEKWKTLKKNYDPTLYAPEDVNYE